MTTRDDAVRTLYRATRIDPQLRFYKARAFEYGRARSQAIVARNILLLLAALCGVAGAATVPEARVVLGIAGGLLGALAGAVTGFEALIGFEQLAKLYGDAGVNLELAAIGWVDSDADLATDVARVETVFERETAQWGQLRRSANGGPGTGR